MKTYPLSLSLIACAAGCGPVVAPPLFDSGTVETSTKPGQRYRERTREAASGQGQGDLRSDENADAGNSGTGGDVDRPFNALRLTVSSPVAEGQATAARTIDLSSQVDMPHFSARTVEFELPQVKQAVEVYRGDNRDSVHQDGHTGSQRNWSVPLDQEGPYTVQVTATHPKEAVFPYAAPFLRRFIVDRTPPELALSGSVTVGADGQRSFSAQVLARDATAVRCDKGLLSDPLTGEQLAFEWEPVEPPSGTSDQTALRAAFAASFRLEPGAPGEDPAQGPGLVLSSSCFDAADNPATGSVAVGETLPELSLAIEVNNGRGRTAGDSASLQYVASGLAEIGLKLLNAADGEPLAPAVQQRAQSLLKVVVSEGRPLTAADLGSDLRSYFLTDFEETVSYPLLRSVQESVELYVHLIEVDPETLEERIIAGARADVEVDPIGALARWEFQSPAGAARASERITAAYRETVDGAPVMPDGRALEFSGDGQNWNVLQGAEFSEAAFGVDPSPGVVVSFTYPYSDEQPFRLRLRLTDLAGNVTVSDTSPQVVGPAELFPLPADPAASACQTSEGRPGSALKGFLVSRVVCGTELGAAVLVGLVNYGAGAVFPVDSGRALGLRLSDGVTEEFRSVSFSLLEQPGGKGEVAVIAVPLGTVDRSPNLRLELDVVPDSSKPGGLAPSTREGTTCYSVGQNGRVQFPEVNLSEAASVRGGFLQGAFACGSVSGQAD